MVELMNLFWTAAGLYPGTGEISPYDFRARVESAARAGFKGIGLWHTDLEHCQIHYTLPEMRQILDDNGMKHLELEFITDWFLDGARKAESDVRKRRLLEASVVLNAHHVKIGDFYNTPYSMPRLIESFAALCKEAEDYGATIGFEFMASAMLNTWEGSRNLVESADAKNGGLIIDIVHVMNIGISYDEIRTLPVNYLVNVELNDGALRGSPLYDPSRERRFCGEGDFDIRGFIACIREMAYTGPWAVEVFSRELAGLPMDELNTRSFQSTMAQF
jgi:sugar phosphate isomerase/epimerase